jgi:hypothetical protein
MTQLTKKQSALFILIGSLLIAIIVIHFLGYPLINIKHKGPENSFEIKYPLAWEINNGKCHGPICSYFEGTRPPTFDEYCDTGSLSTLTIEKNHSPVIFIENIPTYANSFGLIEKIKIEGGTIYISPLPSGNTACAFGSEYHATAIGDNNTNYTIELSWDHKSYFFARRILSSFKIL